MRTEFRGLSHIVETWRSLGPATQLTVKQIAQPLASILETANDYMNEIEDQETVNEEGPIRTVIA